LTNIQMKVLQLRSQTPASNHWAFFQTKCYSMDGYLTLWT